MAEALQVALNGLASGSLYAMIAIGYALVFGTLRFVNFAHGDVCMVGAYFVCAGLMLGLPAPLAIAIGALLAGALSAGLFWLVYRPLLHDDRLLSLVAAVAVSLLLQHGVQTAVSADALPFPLQASDRVWALGGEAVLVRAVDVAVFGLALSSAALVWVLTQASQFGLAMRAIASQAEAASVCGVPVRKVMAGTFFLSGVLACASSTLQATLMGQLQPTMGFATGLKAFLAAVLGGIDSIWGAFFGGLLLGLFESVCIEFGLSHLKEALVGAALVLALLGRPNGLFGSPSLARN